VDENPDVVFIFFGANDAVDPSVKQFVPLAQYSSNIKLMVTELRMKLKEVTLVLITPPPVWEEKLMEMNVGKGKPLALDRTNTRTLEYVNACKEAGQELAVPVLDLWTALEGPSDRRALYLLDGLHLNDRGNECLAEELRRLVLTRLPHLSPQALPMHLPDWTQRGQK